MQSLEKINEDTEYKRPIQENFEVPSLSLADLELEGIKSKLSQIRMCEDMLRKDFELLKVQSIFGLIFSDVEFFSKPNDDLISIEHAIQISHKKTKLDFQGEYFNHMYECCCLLAFSNGVGTAEEKSKFLVNLMFQASVYIKQFEAISFFLREFMKSYPQIELPWAKSFLSEATAENWTNL